MTAPAPNRAEKTARLRAALAAGPPVAAPGVFDLISARVADRLGAAALYMTGYGVSASHLGLPDAGFAGYGEMIARVRQICARTATPLIADADTGYGGPVHARRAALGYAAAGAAAIQIEDQQSPKKCGHTAGRAVVPIEEMVAKIRAAADARAELRGDGRGDLLLIARTDAREAHGLDAALRRAEAYRAAGADLLFVEAMETEAEIERAAARLGPPLVANLVEGGRTPLLAHERLGALGYRLVIRPACGFLAAAEALERAYRAALSGATTGPPLYSFDEMNRLMGFEEVWELERRYGATEEEAAE